MTSLEHDTTNDTRLTDFMTEVREFGRNSAQGKDSLPNLAHAFVRAVCDGVLDVKEDADGHDGAARVFHEYAKSEGKKAVHNRSTDSLKAQISKLRALQKFAANPKWDAVDVMNRAFVIHRDNRDVHELDVKPAYAAYVDLAREQLKQDDALTDAQISAVMCKSTNQREVTLESKLEKIKKTVEGIITGEDKDGIKDQSPEIIQVQELLAQRLAALMQAAQQKLEDDKIAEATAIIARRAQSVPQIAA